MLYYIAFYEKLFGSKDCVVQAVQIRRAPEVTRYYHATVTVEPRSAVTAVMLRYRIVNPAISRCRALVAPVLHTDDNGVSRTNYRRIERRVFTGGPLRCVGVMSVHYVYRTAGRFQPYTHTHTHIHWYALESLNRLRRRNRVGIRVQC